ncbi:unnamed protein product [Linum trigynum]|uniref:Uncharacterized protein n=1 Tax=Linum trigynum TaxID=586398 RepID=A0AAV2CEF8_9ROSI
MPSPAAKGGAAAVAHRKSKSAASTSTTPFAAQTRRQLVSASSSASCGENESKTTGGAGEISRWRICSPPRKSEKESNLTREKISKVKPIESETPIRGSLMRNGRVNWKMGKKRQRPRDGLGFGKQWRRSRRVRRRRPW